MKSMRQLFFTKAVGATCALLCVLSLPNLLGQLHTTSHVNAAVFADEDVRWTSFVNTTASANTIRKTAGRNDGTFDGSGVSQQTITNNGYYEFKATGADVERVTGLTDTPGNTDPASLDFYVNLSEGGIAEFRERSVYLGDTTFVVGDTFRITLINGRAEFSKNGTILRGSNAVITSAMTAVASFSLLNGEISSARLGNISGGGACVPPTVSFGPTIQRVCEGSAWSYVVTVVSGTGPFTYQWLKDGVVIPGATETTYGKAQGQSSLSDAGNYTVRVTNACGTVTGSSSNLPLQVQGLTGLSPATANYAATGGTGRITISTGVNQNDNSCGYVITATPSWITGRDDTGASGPGAWAYTVAANTGAARTGVVTVSNPARTRSFNHTITQAGVATCTAPVLDVLRPVSPPNVVCEGRTFTYTAPAVLSGTGPFTYQWLKNGAAISGATGTTYTTPMARSQADGGAFSVRVTNACGSTTSNESTLGVNLVTGTATPSSFPTAGGTGTVIVSVGNRELGCGRNVVSNVNWLTVTPIPTSDNVNFTVASNPGAARTGTLTVGFQFTLTISQAGATGGGNVQDVIWTQLQNATATGGTIRKTGGANDGSYDGSGLSQQMFANNGYYEFTVGGADVERVTGLSDTPANQDFTSFDFYVNLSEGGIAEFRERGQYLGDTAYHVGDVFRITVENGRARYSRNGVTLANGTAFTAAPLKAVAVFSLLNGEVTQAKLGGLTGGCSYSIAPTNVTVQASGATGAVAVSAPGGCAWTATSNAPSWLTITSGANGNGNGSVGYRAAANTGAQRTGTLTIAGQTFTVTQQAAAPTSPDITWTQLRNISLIGKTLRKTGGANDGTYDGSAVSQELLTGGTGYLEFTVSGPYVRRSIGFSRTFTAGQADSIDYQLNLSNSDIIEFRYRGQYLGDAVYRVGDTIRISIENSRVVAYVNARAFAETTVRPSYPLYVWAAFSTLGGEISNPKLYTGQLPTLQQRRTPFDIYNNLPDDGSDGIPAERRQQP